MMRSWRPWCYDMSFAAPMLRYSLNIGAVIPPRWKQSSVWGDERALVSLSPVLDDETGALVGQEARYRGLLTDFWDSLINARAQGLDVSIPRAHDAGMRIVADALVGEHVRDLGGTLYVWTDRHRCCGGAITFLKTGDSPPEGRSFARYEGDGYAVCFDAGAQAPPEELNLELRGRRSPQVEAYWDGCVYAI